MAAPGSPLRLSSGPEPFGFRVERHSSVTDQAYELLKWKILSGEYPGGYRLNPAAIGAELGMSRTPVREALQRLDLQGLVTLGRNRGAVVTRLTADEVRELFKIRTSLEMLAASEAARNIQEDARDEFELMLRRLERADTQVNEWFPRHEAFHDRIYQFAGMPRLSAEIKRFREAVEPYLRLYIEVYQHTEMPGVEHRNLLQEIASGDPLRAAEAVRQHVDHAADGVLNFLSGDRQYASPSTSKDSTR